jgi:uncharacterized protein YqeY
MTFRDRIQDDLKAALKEGRKDAVRTLRMLQAALKNREIEVRHPLNDDEVTRVIQGQVKQRNDSIAQYEAGNRPDLVAQERAEADLLAAYLPEPLSEAELDGLVDAAIREVGAGGMKDMGAVMKHVLAACGGRADGSVVNAKVRARLA